MRLRTLSTALSLTLAAACSGSPGTGTGGSTGSGIGVGSGSGGGGTADLSIFTPSTSCTSQNGGCNFAYNAKGSPCPPGWPTPGLCPTANLVGCCVLTDTEVAGTPIVSGICDYSGTVAEHEQACASVHGTWTTSPL